jgi:hypothetical protein
MDQFEKFLIQKGSGLSAAVSILPFAISSKNKNTPVKI